MVKTLINLIDERLDNLNNTDTNWVIFVNDHINYIKENSSPVIITDADRDRYRYKFKHFLRENKCNRSIFWIATLINELTMYEDFVLKEYILIPNISYIKNLYRQYRTSRNMT